MSSRGGKIFDLSHSLYLAPLLPLLILRRLPIAFSVGGGDSTSTQMADIETLGILQDIESLVADKLQVVTTPRSLPLPLDSIFAVYQSS